MRSIPTSRMRTVMDNPSSCSQCRLWTLCALALGQVQADVPVGERGATNVGPLLGDVAACLPTCNLRRAAPFAQALAPETFARGVAENGATRARFRLFPLLLMILAMVS